MEESRKIELMCQLARADSLQQICDLAYEITGNPIFIHDQAQTILAYTKCVEIDDEVWLNRIVKAQPERYTINQYREVESVHITSKAEMRPVVVSDTFVSHPHIIKALIQDHKTVGALVLTAYCKPLEDIDIHLVELISSFALSCLKKHHFQFSDSHNSIENYFVKLLDGADYTREQVAMRMDIAGYRIKPCTYVLALCGDEHSSGHSEEILSQIRRDVSAALNCPVLFYNDLLICIYGCDSPVCHWPDDVPELEEVLEKWGLICGISRQLTHMVNLREHYMQALTVLEKARLLYHRERCYRYDSMAAYLLLDHIPQEQLELYCHEQIQRLWAYDREHDTELCPTLQVYLEQAKSLAKTAELLYIHRNTVRYRIKRCMELLGDDLEDGNEIFAYVLSLRIREYKMKLCAPKGEKVN